jgi:hypothetical protein
MLPAEVEVTHFYGTALVPLFNLVLHLLPVPLGFHWVGGCWDRTQEDCRDFASDIVTARLDLIHNSVRSHPQTRLDLILGSNQLNCHLKKEGREVGLRLGISTQVPVL